MDTIRVIKFLFCLIFLFSFCLMLNSCNSSIKQSNVSEVDILKETVIKINIDKDVYNAKIKYENNTLFLHFFNNKNALDDVDVFTTENFIEVKSGDMYKKINSKVLLNQCFIYNIYKAIKQEEGILTFIKVDDKYMKEYNINNESLKFILVDNQIEIFIK